MSPSAGNEGPADANPTEIAAGANHRAGIATAAVPTLAAMALAGYLSAAVAGVVAGVVTALSVGFAAAVVLSWPRRGGAGEATSVALAALLGGITLFFAFNAGGYFPGSPALGAVVLLLVLCLRLSLARRPLAGLSGPFAVAAGATALLVMWQALSAVWSGAPARALLEADRTLLYLSLLIFFGSFARSRRRLQWLIRGLVLALLGICIAALGVWLLPDMFVAAPSYVPNRLSFPVTYWNTLGLLAAIGTILSFHMTGGDGQPRVVRVLGAAAVPIFATTIFFTFSRGAIATGLIGLFAYVLLSRRWHVVSATVATLPPTAAAVFAASQAGALASLTSSVAQSAAQGRALAPTLLACALVGGVLRAALLPLDPSLWKLHKSRRARAAGITAIATTLLASIVVALALGAPSALGRYLDRFAERPNVASQVDARDRLLDPSSTGRVLSWRVAAGSFAESPVSGAGAGTYALAWDRNRAADVSVIDAHSLYLETGSELGLVGIVLLALPLGLILGKLASGLRRPNRAAYAALFAVMLAWGVRAGIDWDWEMPVATAWVFAVGGAVLARRSGGRGGQVRPVVRLLAGCLIVALAILPARIAVSEARLERARTAYTEPDCGATKREARAAATAMPSRPEPYELNAFCEFEDRQYRQAAASMQAAANRDPQNWRYLWGLAVTKGAAGDGAGASRAEQSARHRNPLEPTSTPVGRRTTEAWRQEGAGLLPSVER